MTSLATSAKSSARRPGCWLALVVLLVPLLLLFYRSIQPNEVLFANDCPLGAISSHSAAMPGTFKGLWQDLNWLGMQQPSALPNISSGIYFLSGIPFGSVHFAKFYAPLSLLILGMSAWFFLRTLRFSLPVCVVGGLAAMLNSNFFSNACWGLPTRALTLANVFLALAAIRSIPSGRAWIKVALAGVAVGLSLMEGYDVAAIFSLYVAAYALFATVEGDVKAPVQWVKGSIRVAVVAIVAAIVAAQALSTLVGTQVKGMVQTKDAAQNTEAGWNYATQWSLPKAETLRVLIPGLFGYRMDTPDGGNYWGTVGQQPGWPEHHQGFPRHSGSGEYAGVLVVLMALWAMAQAGRKKESVFDASETRHVWFWAAVAGVSLLLAFGRHAPFFRLAYALPFFNTIRAPIKFMHPFHMALLILCGYGLQALARQYFETARGQAGSVSGMMKTWWSKTSSFERKWVFGLFALCAVSLVGLLMFASSGPALERYLQATNFNEETAKAIVRFSMGEVVWYCVFLLGNIGLLVLIMSGWLTGRRARWGWALLGIWLAVDLMRANAPWIVYYDYKVKYASNPVVDILKEKPWEQRVTAPTFLTSPQAPYFPAICNEWLQHHFQYYNIQSLDVVQMPREPLDHQVFMGLFTTAPSQVRLWELTNTRYVLGMRGFLDALNNQLDPVQKRFRVRAAFDFTQDESGVISTVLKPDGMFALFEFTGALPRAALYSNWQVETNEPVILKQLADPSHDVGKTVLVHSPLDPPAATTTNADTGTVAFTSYAPKHVVLSAQARSASVLLLNDRYDPNWQVWVDGKPADLLRCNYLMQGVHLEAGQHTVEFKFTPSIAPLYVSLAGLGVACIFCLVLIVGAVRKEN